MGLDPPQRDENTGEITNLPLRKELIPWLPRVPIRVFFATVGWRVQVRIFEKRALRETDNEALRQTIIERFKTERFCKHCYRWINPKDYKCHIPKEWTALLPGVTPICIHCFTHRFSDKIDSSENLVVCPKCKKFRSERKVYRFIYTGGPDNQCDFYKCTKCDGPKLYVRQNMKFTPHVEAWKRKCLGLEPELTDEMKRSDEIKKKRKIQMLKDTLDFHLREIRYINAKIASVAGEEYKDIVIHSAPSPEIKRHKKGPTEPDKSPVGLQSGGVRAMMSPTMSKRSGERPRESYDEEEEEEEAE